MRKKSLFTVAMMMMMMISMAGVAHAAGAEALPIPPGLEVGQLPLRFREPVKADAPEKIVADVWQRSKEIRSQNLATYLKQQPEKVAAGPWRFAWWLSALHQQYRLPEANAFMRENMARETAAYVYLMFGPEGKYPNRLEPQTLSILKEHMWKEVNYWLDPAGEFLQSPFDAGCRSNCCLAWPTPGRTKNNPLPHRAPRN